MILKLPMCPSSNHMYTPVNGRLIKSVEARRYLNSIKIINLQCHKILDDFKSKITPNSVLSVDYYFVFPKERYFTKKHEIRKVDHSNRLKIVQDCVSELIGLDDSHFIDGRILKTYWDKKDEVIFVKLNIIERPIEFLELGLELK